MQQESIDSHVPKTKQKMWSGMKVLGVVVIAGVIFVTGLNVGNGTIQFGQLENTQNKDLPADLDYSSVERVYDELKTKYDGKLDTTKLLDGIKAGLAEASGDPYTVYMSAEEADAFNKQIDGTAFSGVGAELGEDDKGNLIVVSPIAGFPADKAGLRPQDLIVSIDEESTAGLSIEEAVSKIRGPKGTKVTLKILRDKKQDLTFTITRDDIKVPSVKYEILDGNIGYLQISQFINDTSKLSKEAAQAFKDKNVKGVILDVRGDPGGLLDAAINVSSLWLPKGKTILQERRGGIVISTNVATGGNLLTGIPTVVLVNEGSASASEIVAGALKDNDAATIIGVKSYGKGSVQEVESLASGGQLKVTVARWYRPNGQNIDKKGITPDTTITMSEDDFTNRRDPQKQAAIDFLKK